MDIGTLTGAITIEDALSAILEQASSKVKKFSQEFDGSMESTQQSMQKSGTIASFLGNTLSSYAMQAVSWGKNLVTSSLMAGARLEQLGVATRFLGEKAGYSEQYIDELAKKIQATGISGISTRESIQSLLGANIDLAQATKLSAIAQNMQSISGKSSSEVFQTMTRALATGNSELLRGIGFQTISLEGLKAQNKAQTGFTGVLSAGQRTQMIMNAMIKEGTGMMGLYAESMTTAGKQASSAERAWSEVSEQIGTTLLPITSMAIKAWYKFGQSVRDAVADSRGSVENFVKAVADGLQSIITKTTELASKTVDAGKKIYAAYEAVPDIIKKIGAAAVIAAVGVWALNSALVAVTGSAIVKGLMSIMTQLAIAQTIGGAGGFSALLVNVKSSITPLLTGFAKFRALIAEVIVLLTPFATAIVTFIISPVGLTIAAIVLLVGAIRLITGSWEFLLRPMRAIWEVFKDIWTIITVVWTSFTDGVKEIIDLVKNSEILNISIALVKDLFNEISEVMSGRFSLAIATAKKDIESLWDLLLKIPTPLKNFIDAVHVIQALAAETRKNDAAGAAAIELMNRLKTPTEVGPPISASSFVGPPGESISDRKPQPAPTGGGGGAADDYAKKVASLLKTLTQGDESVRVFASAFEKLNEKQLASIDVQRRLVPEFDKLIAAGQKLTPQMMEEYNAAQDNIQASMNLGVSTLQLKGVTLEYIDALRLQGASTAKIAADQGVSVEAMTKYEAMVREITAATGTDAEIRAKIDADDRARQERAADLVTAMHAKTDAVEAASNMRKQQASMTTTQIQLDNIEREILAETKGLDMSLEANKEYEAALRTASQHEIDLVNTTQDTIVERMKAAGVQTQASLHETAQVSLKVWMQMVNSGQFTAEQIATAWKKHMDDVAAVTGKTAGSVTTALSMLGSSIASMFEGINSKVGQSFKILGSLAESWGEITKSAATKAEKSVQKAGVALGALAGLLSNLAGENPSKWMQAAVGAATGATGGLATGAYIGSLFGPGGTAIGAGVGAAIGALTGAIIGWTTAAKKARDANKAATDQVQEFKATLISTYGSLENISTIGKIVGTDLEQAWGDQSQEGLKHFKALMDDFQKKMTTLTSALEEYGLSWRDLGIEMRQMTMTDTGNKLWETFTLMTSAGVDTDLAIRKMGPSLSQLVVDAVTTGTKVPGALQPIIEKLIKMGGLTDAAAKALLGMTASTMPSLADITAAAERYGLKLDDLGLKVQQLRIDEQAAQISADFKLLAEAGVPFNAIMKDTKTQVTDTGASFTEMSAKAQAEYIAAGGVVSTVTVGMHNDIQQMVLKSIATGAELPAVMKPLIDDLIASGGDNGLVDQLGNALTDTGKLTFAKDLSGMFETLIDKLNEFIGVIKDGVVPSLVGIGKTNVPPIEIGYYYSAKNELPGGGDVEQSRPYATGGRVLAFTPRGTDTVPAMLTPGERVLTQSQNQAYENGGQDIVVVAPISMDGMKVGESLVRVRGRLGLGR